MDFYAQAYTTDSRAESPNFKHSPLQSPRNQHEGVCQGYGSEANAHLRRASSGLESDMGHRLHSYSSYSSSSHPNTGGNKGCEHTGHAGNRSDYSSPSLIKSTHQGSEHSYFSLGASSYASHDPHHRIDSGEASTAQTANSPLSSPSLHRKTSVSNPCLLHHTNSNGSGVVRPPVMPHTRSSAQLSEDRSLSHATAHEPTIMEGRELSA
ncbi:hypothetical protein EDD11_004417 [Mortierella claussenii]|nr:hypothetical protein EDD11_004417 [Mortierella claussenii]